MLICITLPLDKKLLVESLLYDKTSPSFSTYSPFVEYMSSEGICKALIV
jgi:hypothetical protein